jgi:hypothetical protein
VVIEQLLTSTTQVIANKFAVRDPRKAHAVEELVSRLQEGVTDG